MAAAVNWRPGRVRSDGVRSRRPARVRPFERRSSTRRAYGRAS
jgi:hypothetical protein